MDDFDMDKASLGPVAIVVSRFNATVTNLMSQHCQQRLLELGLPPKDLLVYPVPGAIEIPIICQHILQKKSPKAVIALGVVIQGETDHYDYVCQSVAMGCQHVALTFTTPVIFGVLTTKTKELALARANGEHSNKGAYCAEAAIELIQLQQTITNQ